MFFVTIGFRFFIDLVMAGRTERLDAVMAQVYEETKAYCNEKQGGME